MEKLKTQAKSLMSMANQLRSRWSGDMGQMAADTQKWTKQVGFLSGAFVLAASGMRRFAGGLNGIAGGNQIFRSLAVSMGMVPKGMETFPKLILDVVRFVAAIQLLQGSLTLLGRLGAAFSTLRIGGPIFRGIGAAIAACSTRVLTLSVLVGTLGNRFRALSFARPLFGAIAGQLTRLSSGLGVAALGASRMRLGLAPLARAPGMFGAMNGAISKLIAPFSAVSSLAFKVAASFYELSIAKAMMKPLLMLEGAFAALKFVVSGLDAIISSVAGELIRLSGVLGVAAGGVISLGLAAGIAAVAFNGFGDALKSGDISKLHAEAGKAVTSIRAMSGEWTKFQNTMQGSVFSGVSAEIDKLKGKLGELTPAANRVAVALNVAIKQVLAFANSGRAVGDLKLMLDASGRAVTNLSATIQPLLSILFDVGAVGSKVFADLTAGAGATTRSWAEFVSKARESGQLEAWMRGGIESIRELWRALVAIKNVWTTVMDGLSGGDRQVKPLFTAIADGAEALNRFFQSAQGADILATLGGMMDRAGESALKLGRAFMDYVYPAIKAFLPYMEALGTGVIDGIVVGLAILAPLFYALGSALSFLAPIFEPIMAFMIKSVVLYAGLVVALAITTKAIFLLKYGLDTLRTAWSIGAFMVRLFTGNLKKGEASVLRFAGTVIANAVAALWAKIKALALASAAMVRYVAMMVWGAITTAARWVWARVVIVAQWVWMAISAVANAIRTATVWVVQTLISTARVVLAWIMTRIQIFVIWMSLVIQSAIQSALAFLSWATQATIATARMILAWVIARVQLMLIWVTLTIQSLIQSMLAFMSWAIQATLATARMVLAWTLARIQLMLQWLLIRTMAIVNAIGAFIPWVIQSTIATMQMILAWTLARVQLMIQWLMIRVAAITNAIGAFLPWVIQSTIAVAQMVAAWIMARIQTVIQWTIMAAQAMARAVMMAAAWVVAMGPVGWVIAIVVALVVLIIANWDRIKAATIAAWNAISTWITTKINQAKAIVQGVITTIVAVFRNGWNAAKAAVVSALAAAVAAVASGIARMLSYVSSLPGRIRGFFASAGTWLINAGRAILEGLLNGLKAAWNAVAGFVGGLASQIAALKGPLPKDKKLLIPAGIAIMMGLRDGLRKGFPTVARELADITDRISNQQITAPSTRALVRGDGSNAAATNAAIAAWNPRSRPTGAGVGEQQTINDYGGISVTIPAKDLDEMRNITDFFDKVTQTARAGKAPDA